MESLLLKPLRYAPATAADFVKLGTGQADLNEYAPDRSRGYITRMSWNGRPQLQPMMVKNSVTGTFGFPEIEPT